MKRRLTALLLMAIMFISLSRVGAAETPQELDFSSLSSESENISQTFEKYSYTWSIDDSDINNVVRTLELTLNGALISTLFLPCRQDGEVHIVINTEEDSYIEKIKDGQASGYYYHWNTITFNGPGKLETGSMDIQGGGNDHIITVAQGASVEITGDRENLGFGASGNSYSTLNVSGKLTVNGNVSCGQVKIGPEGVLVCGRVTLSGNGAFDTDGEIDSLVMADGSRLVAKGDTYETDNETGEQYGALTVNARDENIALNDIIKLPDGYLPVGYSIKRAEYYVTVDNADEKEPKSTSFEFGVIYGANALTLPYTIQNEISFNSNGGSYVSSITINNGEKAVKPASPTRSGYNFVGWYNEELTVEYDFETAVTSSFTLYAKWQKIQSGGGGGGGVTNHTVKFETNSDMVIPDKRIMRNSKLEKPADPIKDDFVFDGWYTDDSFENPYNFDSRVTKSFTLYAKWSNENVGGILNTNEHFAYIKGYQDNTVRPESNITRAETAEVFNRLLEEEIRNKNNVNENSFFDVHSDAWYNTSVSVMEKLGIIKGKSSHLFVPDDFITRGEFAAICARFDDSDFEIKDSFTDIDGHWAENEIYEAAAHGWIKGYEDGSFRPDEFITRAEAIALINRMLGRMPKALEDLRGDMIKWKDNNDVSAWYYIAIQEATNDHSYLKASDGSEKWK